MPKHGDIINGSIETTELFGQSSAFEADRFESVGIYNDSSSWVIHLMLVSGFDEGSTIEPGFVRETKIIVAVGDEELQPGGHQYTRVDDTIRCKATRIKARAEIKNKYTGKMFQIQWNDALATDNNGAYDPENTFLTDVIFHLPEVSDASLLSNSCNFQATYIIGHR